MGAYSLIANNWGVHACMFLLLTVFKEQMLERVSLP